MGADNWIKWGVARKHCGSFCDGLYMSACFCRSNALYLDCALFKSLYLSKSNPLESKERSNRFFNRDTGL